MFKISAADIECKKLNSNLLSPQNFWVRWENINTLSQILLNGLNRYQCNVSVISINNAYCSISDELL